jgi:Mg/Co/Ni transporter MgtE
VLDPVTKGYIALRPAAAARTLMRLDVGEIKAIFEAMPGPLAANVLEQMAPEAAGRCLEQLTTRTGGEILARMPVLAAAAVLRLMQRDQVKMLLAVMPHALGARLRLRLRYSETVIGAFVDAEVVTFSPHHRVSDALRLFRRAGQRTGQIIFVLDEHSHLAGVVDLSDLLTQRDRSMVRRVMRPASIVLNARAPLQTVTNNPAWLTHDSLPVVNREGIFQGVLRRSRVMHGEQALLTEVAEHNELDRTRRALADIFWIGVSALFVGNTGRVARDKAED